jgi:hypothetical protein
MAIENLQNLISALFIFNITFLARAEKEKGGGLPISAKQNTQGGRAVSKNKTPGGSGIPFFEVTNQGSTKSEAK